MIGVVAGPALRRTERADRGSWSPGVRAGRWRTRRAAAAFSDRRFEDGGLANLGADVEHEKRRQNADEE